MKSPYVLPIPLFTALLLIYPVIGLAQITPSDAGKQYWLKGSTRLSDDDPRSARARHIFDRTLAAADKRPGPSPELIILDEEGFPWARSLPDGSIIVTRGALDICFRAKTAADGDARLAFVIGHELSHQVNGDFWHFFFYQGLHPDSAKDEQTRKTLEQVIKIAKRSDSVWAKELQADQYGLLYASQAGYDVKRIVDTDTNFFREWTAATSPALLEGIVMQVNHPKIEERSAAALSTLQRVVEKIEVFEKGVEAYKKASYTAAMYYFKDFLSVYQSREGFNNLGLVHYQMAAEEYAKWKSETPMFRLSLIIDPTTRARNAYRRRRSPGSPLAHKMRPENAHESQFRKHAAAAAGYFREAWQRDHTYAMAHNNLACVYFLKSEYASAVGELDKAISIDPGSPEAFNNRAVAYLEMGKRLRVKLNEKVESNLLTALKLRPDYEYALFNMAYFLMQNGRNREKQKYKDRLAKLHPGSELLALIR